LFSKAVRECLAKAEPEAEDERWVAFCGVYLFCFGRVGEEVRLLEFGVDPEAGLD
jgi:hypothetical protein